MESTKLKISMWQNITETLIYFLYNEDIQDKTLVNLNLLYAADKYNVPRLVEICAAYLKLSLYVFNVLDILVAAHHGLAGSFQGCLKLCLQKKGQLANTGAWEEIIKANPTLVATALSKVLLGVPTLKNDKQN